MNFLKTRAFPSFYQEYAPKLIEFFGAWIDWMNEQDNMVYVVDHLSSESDIDESVNRYATSIKDKLLVDYPETIASDLKLLLKNIFYLYNSKSSIESYDFLFRCLYDSPAKIIYPRDSILYASDGRWNTPKYMSTVVNVEENKDKNDIDVLSRYVDCYIKGKESLASAYVRGSTIYSFAVLDNDGNTVRTVRNCVSLFGVNGGFKNKELLEVYDINGNKVEDLSLYVEYYEIADGTWTDSHGLLDSDMVLQDGKFYQRFSYVIRSKVSVERWKSLVKSVIHPSGLQVFGELMLGEDEDGVTKLDVYPGKDDNPEAYLVRWYKLLRTYVYDTTSRINFRNWVATRNVLAQRHSETMDAWLYYGRYHQKDGFSRVLVKDANTIFNRSSVMMFRDDGTLIHPNIIEWATFSFTEPLLSKFGNAELESKEITGVTINSSSHVICKEINNSKIFTDLESFVDKNFMFFTTQSNPNQSSVVEGLTLDSEYINPFTESSFYVVNSAKPHSADSKVILYKYDESIDDYISDKVSWSELQLSDFIRTNGASRQIYGKNSLLKIPDENIKRSINDDGAGCYTITDRALNAEYGVIFSYTPETFKSRISLSRKNSSVDINYMLYNWFFGKKSSEISFNIGDYILDTNLKYSSEDVELKYAEDYIQETYHCVSSSEDSSGNEYNIQQSQFTLRLPCKVEKDDILLFINGKCSDKFKLKTDDTIVIDTDEGDNNTLYYINNGRVTTDESGNEIVYFLHKKKAFSSVNATTNEKELNYYIQESRIYNVADINGKVCYFLTPSTEENELYKLIPISNNYSPLVIDTGNNVRNNNNVVVMHYMSSDGTFRRTVTDNSYVYKIKRDEYYTSYEVTSDFDGTLPSKYTSFDYFDIKKIETYSEEDNNIVLNDTPVYRLYKPSVETIINNRLISCKKIVLYNTITSVVYYLKDDGNIINNAGNIVYKLVDNNIIDVSTGSPTYQIQDYEILKSTSDNSLLYWNNNYITNNIVFNGDNILYTVLDYGILVDHYNVIHYHVVDNEIKTEPFVDDTVYYILQNNTISNVNYKYNYVQTELEDCSAKSVISSSQTNSMKLLDMDINSEILYNLQTSDIKVLGNFILSDFLYYIYDIKQSSVNSSAEIYILSNISGCKKETSVYEGNKDNSGGNFIYNQAVLSPFALSNSKIECNHIVDLKDYIDSGIDSYNWNLLRTNILQTDVNYIKQTSINSVPEQTIMPHYTMDNMLYIGDYNHSDIGYQNEDEDSLTEYLYVDNEVPVFYAESRLNKYSTMVFDDSGCLINPNDIHWGLMRFVAPQNTKSITVVSLDSFKPAIVGDMVYNKNSYSYYVDEDDFIRNNIMLFVNGKKAFVKYTVDSNGNQLQDNISYFKIGDNVYTLTNTGFINDGNEKLKIIYRSLGSLCENNYIVDDTGDFNNISIFEGDDNVYIQEEVLGEHKHSLSILEELTEDSIVLSGDSSVKTCVVFQYNPKDLDALIQEYQPKQKMFELPHGNYEKRNILVFVNGYQTTNYTCEKNIIVVHSDNIETLEIYVFKPYDYLYVDENKYNNNYYDFTVKNIKQNMFF